MPLEWIFKLFLHFISKFLSLSSGKANLEMRIPVQVIYQEGEAVAKTGRRGEESMQVQVRDFRRVLCRIASAGGGRGPLGC